MVEKIYGNSIGVAIVGDDVMMGREQDEVTIFVLIDILISYFRLYSCYEFSI